ncbi:MAG TPA: LPS assembly lipoprotein LptE [Vicinamibacteria bacterium]|nr:LPS assembly lipoprotein LptE [Vicinamibacteria bacterium]
MRRRDALVAMGAGLLGGCGYALEGRGISVDPSIKKVGVPLFKDETGKPGLDQKITDKVIEELLRRGRFNVVQTATGVDAVVDGTLLSYHTQPIGFSRSDGTRSEANRYVALLTARVRYAKPDAEQPIWESEGFTQRDEYDIGEDAESYFDREEQAQDRMAVAFAKAVVAAMLEAF